MGELKSKKGSVRTMSVPVSHRRCRAFGCVTRQL